MMQAIFLVFILFITSFCCTTDEQLIKKTTQQFIAQRSMANDPIIKSTKTDKEQVIFYLQIARNIICDLLVKNPIGSLSHYRRTDEYQIGLASPTIKAKVQALFPEELKQKIHHPKASHTFSTAITAFLSFKEAQTTYLYRKDSFYENPVPDIISALVDFKISDLAVSPTNTYLCSVDNYWTVTVWDILSKNGPERYDTKVIDNDMQKIFDKIGYNSPQSPRAKETSIICAGNYWYCAVDNNVYQFQIGTVMKMDTSTSPNLLTNSLTDDNDPAFSEITAEHRKIHNIQKVVSLNPNNIVITKLVIDGHVLIVNVIDNNKSGVYLFDLGLKENNGYLKALDTSDYNALNVILYNQSYVLLVDKKNRINNVKPITAYEVAKQRRLAKLSEYLAVDINWSANKIALLKGPAKGATSFHPAILYTDFMPDLATGWSGPRTTHLEGIINNFNSMIGSYTTKKDAQEFLRALLVTYQNFYPRSLSTWEKIYKKINDNIAWVSITVAALVGFGWSYFSKNSSQVPAAWGKIPSVATQKNTVFTK